MKSACALLALITIACSPQPAHREPAPIASTSGSETSVEPTPAIDAPPTEPTPEPTTPEPAAPPSNADALVSADIPSPCAPGRIQLSDGTAQYPSTIDMDTPGSLELQPVATTDLDGDGRDEMLAFVRCMPGGSGTIDSIRAYHVDGGVVVEVAAIEGGDRADGGLDLPHVVNGDVVVGRFSGHETMCCPTHVTAETWRLRQGRFTRTHVGPRRPVEH